MATLPKWLVIVCLVLAFPARCPMTFGAELDRTALCEIRAVAAAIDQLIDQQLQAERVSVWRNPPIGMHTLVAHELSEWFAIDQLLWLRRRERAFDSRHVENQAATSNFFETSFQRPSSSAKSSIVVLSPRLKWTRCFSPNRPCAILD